jgi:hypothetical protein
MVFDSGDGSDRGGQFKTRLITGIVIATLVAATFISFGLLKSAQYEWQADANSGHYSEYTRKKIAETCVAVSALEKAKCVYEARDKKREYRYNQRDLVAQKRSALWAYIMAVAAVVGMALSALGVWLVKTTFDETRTANEIARKSQRPWVSISVNPTILKRQGASIRFEAEIETINKGQMAAKNYQLCFEAIYATNDGPDIVTDAFKRFEKNRKASRKVLIPNDPNTFHYWTYYRHSEIVWGHENSFEANKAVLIFVVSVLYQSDVTGDEWLRTDKAYLISHRKDGNIDSTIDRNFRGYQRGNLVAYPYTSATLGN